jgi:hypothetical protein
VWFELNGVVLTPPGNPSALHNSWSAQFLASLNQPHRLRASCTADTVAIQGVLLSHRLLLLPALPRCVWLALLARGGRSCAGYSPWRARRVSPRATGGHMLCAQHTQGLAAGLAAWPPLCA